MNTYHGDELERKYETVTDLPNDPLDMPPPYWRTSGAVFQIVAALEELCTSLETLRKVLPRINHLLAEYFERNPEPIEDHEEFGDITEPLWEVESKIKSKCELAVFMVAIEAEDLVNRIGVFNLHKDVAQSIEKLNPPEKLLIVAVTLTGTSIKDSKPYEALKKLTSWRNAYAHGHCTDRPTKSLRHNHLISPTHYPTVPKQIEHMLMQLEGYLTVSEYLRSISKNEYTAGSSAHDSDIQDLLEQVRKYKFSYAENGEIYDLEYE